MIIVLGGGNLAQIIYESAIRQKIPVKIFSSKLNKNQSLYSGKNNDLLSKLTLEGENNKCIIVWSFTRIKNFNQFKLSIEGMINILEFIKANPNNEYLYLSSTSADLRYNYLSLYGLSKYIHEKYLSRLISNQPKIKLKILRVGLIYGLKNCPIKKIIKVRALGLKLIFGNQNSNFSVISALDLANNMINEKSILWNKNYKLGYMGESTKMSIKKIHLIYEKLKRKKDYFFKITILKKSFIYKLINFIGIKLDLSLSEVDRFPTKNKSIKYDQIYNIESYIKNI